MKTKDKRVANNTFIKIGYMADVSKTSNGHLVERVGLVVDKRCYFNAKDYLKLTENKHIKFIDPYEEEQPHINNELLLKHKAYTKELRTNRDTRREELGKRNSYYATVTFNYLKLLRLRGGYRELSEVIDYGVVLGDKFYNVKGYYTVISDSSIKSITPLQTAPTWATTKLKELKRAYDIETATHGAVTMQEILEQTDFKGF